MGEADRGRALEWAAISRAARFRLRERLSDGEVTLVEVLEQAGSDPLIGQAKLLWTLESVPGARKVLTRRRLAEIRLDESTRIGALSEQERDLIVANFGDADGGSGGSD
ncbi:MAG: hypothetical protein WBA45_06930 [Microthrixaceae bacterium]